MLSAIVLIGTIPHCMTLFQAVQYSSNIVSVDGLWKVLLPALLHDQVKQSILVAPVHNVKFNIRGEDRPAQIKG